MDNSIIFKALLMQLRNQAAFLASAVECTVHEIYKRWGQGEFQIQQPRYQLKLGYFRMSPF